MEPVQINLRFKLEAVREVERAITVRYFTAEMLQAARPRWRELADQLKIEASNEGRTLTDDEAMEAARQREPIGSVSQFTFYGSIPSPEALYLYVRQRAPLAWLYMKSMPVAQAPDMGHLQALVGRVFSTVEEYLPNS